MSTGGGAIRRRLAATWRIWRRGPAHMEILTGPAVRAEPPDGHIDLPLPGSVLPREPVIFRGWAMFPSGPPARVEVWLGGESLGLARLGAHRPDVRLATGMPAGMIAEFELVGDLGSWTGRAGRAEVGVRATGTRGERLDLSPVAVRVAPDRRPAGPPRQEPRRPLPVASLRPGERANAGPRTLVMTHQLDLGGAQLLLLDLVRAMRDAAALECTVVSPLDGPLRRQLEALGVRVHVTAPFPLHDPDAYDARVEELAALAALGDFDVVLVNTALAFPGADVADRLGLPAVWAIHESYDPSTLWWMFGEALHPDVRGRAERVLAGAAAAVFEADATRRLYEPYLGAGRGVLLPYGLDVGALDAARGRFDRARARRDRGIPDGATVVLCVGTIEPRKAQVPLTQAFGLVADRHPGARLVLLGGRGDEHTRVVERYAADCGPPGRVRVLPVTPDVWPWYGLADLVVLASDVESLPRSVLEAMAWGTPVLASSVFGLPELIEHGATGWLCEPRDVGALAAALDTALGATEDERRRIGAAGRELVLERHALAPYAEACIDLLRAAAEGAHPTGLSAGRAE